VPAYFAAAIDRGLAKDPDGRWQTGRAFAEALAGHPIDSSGSVRTPRRRPKSRTPLIAAAALGVVVLAGALWNSRAGGDGDATAYLVAPFEIQSGDQSVTWLREGSVNMLTMTLGQWSDLNVVDYERTLSLLDKAELGNKPRLSLDDALRMARLANAGTVVTGQISTINDSLVVTARLYDVRSGEQENQAIASALMGADPRPLFDDLAQKLLALEGSGRTSTLQLAQATTTNLEAYRAFLNGVRLLNSWRLYEADTAFDRAIALDSTFALAYHKKSLGLGWGDLSQRDGPADKAHQLAGRLPPRERSLVQGHYHLIRALNAVNQQDTAAARLEFDASIKAYDDLFARGDTLVPEAWHGRADSYHHRRSNGSTPAQLKEWTTQSLRGFSKTLAIDSTFHLAYAHLVELYNSAAAGSAILISGDSALVLTDSIVAIGLGEAGIRSLRDEARRRGIEIARAWTRADDGSTRPFMQLTNSYIAANQPDSALATMHRALSKPRSGEAAARLVLLSVQMSVGDTAVGSTVRGILDRYTVDTLRQIPVAQRFGSEGELMAAAAVAGSARDLERAARLFVAADPTLPTTTTPTQSITDLYSMVLRLAMGEEVTADIRRRLAESIKAISAIPGGIGANIRTGSVSVPYVAYLATRDTTFLSAIKSWGNIQSVAELDAMAALQRRDTAEAMRIAQTFTPPAQLGDARFSVGGLRTMARAEVLEGLGLARQAAETYDAIMPARINRSGLAEPGFTVWVRSWLARARLWRQVGERERAIAAYEEFLRRWQNADGPAARLVSQARQELGQMRDR
jgi:TolB-like protein